MLYTPKERQVKKIKGVIYARYSTDNQREESIEGQLRECKAFAEKNDIQIVETYIDRAFSARTDRRPDCCEISYPYISPFCSNVRTDNSTVPLFKLSEIAIQFTTV